VLQPRDHQAALSLYRDRGGIAQFFLELEEFARVTDPAIMLFGLLPIASTDYSYSTSTRERDPKSVRSSIGHTYDFMYDFMRHREKRGKRKKGR
jgi:hypothetical protein